MWFKRIVFTSNFIQSNASCMTFAHYSRNYAGMYKEYQYHPRLLRYRTLEAQFIFLKYLSSSTNYIFSFQYFHNFFASLLECCSKSYPTWTFPCVYRLVQKLWKDQKYLIFFDIIFPFFLSTTFKVHLRGLSWKVTAFLIRFQNFRVLFSGCIRLPEKV